jgi:outer membrane PBP1 activator LpoA protein
VQAGFMAHYARAQGNERIVIIHDDRHSATEEANAFAQTFTDAGGEIIDTVVLKEGIYDNRPALVAMRSNTDDEELLAELDTDLNLFSPEREFDIKMPLHMDAIYIAAAGKKISVLAGQMAYSDINGVQLYGSYRWFDGHLMDDDGRYLNKAKFATPVTSLSQPDQAILDVHNQYRVIWAEENHISPLFALAYDAAMNIASLGTRLGIEGKDAIKMLSTATEFPAISGNYYFDKHGISQKTFAVQTIRNGKIQAVQITK